MGPTPSIFFRSSAAAGAGYVARIDTTQDAARGGPRPGRWLRLLRLDPQEMARHRKERRRQVVVPAGALIFDLGFGDPEFRRALEQSLMGRPTDSSY